MLARIMLKVPELAREAGCDNGFRTVINTGPDGGQEVYHLHVHVLGGPREQVEGTGALSHRGSQGISGPGLASRPRAASATVARRGL